MLVRIVLSQFFRIRKYGSLFILTTYSQTLLHIMYKYCCGTNLLINVSGIISYRCNPNFNTDWILIQITGISVAESCAMC